MNYDSPLPEPARLAGFVAEFTSGGTAGGVGSATIYKLMEFQGQGVVYSWRCPNWHICSYATFDPKTNNFDGEYFLIRSERFYTLEELVSWMREEHHISNTYHSLFSSRQEEDSRIFSFEDEINDLISSLI